MSCLFLDSSFLLTPPVKQNVIKTAEDVNSIRTDLERKEELAIIEWLTPLNHGSQHSIYRDRRQPDTCRWFLESNEYDTWKDCAGKVLFCQGMPGAGKSVLSALVVEEISSTFGQEANTGLAYIYCDYQRHDQQTPLQLISRLTKQLCLLNTTLPPSVKDLYNLHQPTSNMPSLKAICHIFQIILDRSLGFTLSSTHLTSYRPKMVIDIHSWMSF